MNDIEAWLDFDGPMPEPIRALLDALRDPPPETPEDKERSIGRLCERFDAQLARQGEPSVGQGEPSVGTTGAITRAPGDRAMGEEGATVRSPSLDERLAAPPPAEPPSLPAEPPSLPVEPPSLPAEPPSLPVDAREPSPPAGRPPVEDLKITAVLDIPAEFREQMARWPFKPRAPGAELVWTMQSAVLNLNQGKTAPLGDDSIAKAVAALPFIGNTVGAALVPVPRLRLETYASLRAELLVWPERSAEILPRYHVMNEAARRALEEHWEGELAASPEARATFDKALAEYTAWLRSQRG
ncbi:MAG TPA: hypothetical protein VE093_10960 [Polyangiaceae bacterium]|nr:hypothetical protein [Polyangiaceae bacterium]